MGATSLQSFAYTHDPVGNILSITELTQTRNFTYDDFERLITGGTTALPESYSYDGIGNRSASHLSASHVTNSANRLTEDDSFCYAYDANGNLETKTAKVAGACTGAVTTYIWNAQNQLIQIDFPDLTTAAYRYDGFGRRIEKDVAGVIARYVYDGENILLEYDGTNTLLARYTHGPGPDDPLAMERDLDASGTFEAAERFVYHTDGLGSVTELTDSTGVVARAYAYDAYGRIADEIGTLANPYAYTGREFDAESGFYFYRARYYDPETGRFLSEDPIHFAGLDVNLYRYVFNNPVNLTDPTGQILPAIIGAGCIAGAIGGVIGGFNGTVVGAITAITISEAQSGGGGGGGSSNDGCGDADSTEPPPAIPTPTPGDFLRNAAVDALLGCLAGGIAVIGLNPATVFTAAAIASSVGVTEGFITGFVGQIKQVF